MMYLISRVTNNKIKEVSKMLMCNEQLIWWLQKANLIFLRSLCGWYGYLNWLITPEDIHDEKPRQLKYFWLSPPTIEWRLNMEVVGD